MTDMTINEHLKAIRDNVTHLLQTADESEQFDTAIIVNQHLTAIQNLLASQSEKLREAEAKMALYRGQHEIAEVSLMQANEKLRVMMSIDLIKIKHALEQNLLFFGPNTEHLTREAIKEIDVARSALAAKVLCTDEIQ